MSFKQFPKDLFFKPLSANEKIKMGSFNTLTNEEIFYGQILLTIYNKTITTEKVRVNIYSDENYSDLLFSSNYSDLINIENISSYWLGLLRVDFDRQNIQKNSTYYFEIEGQNISYSNNSFIAFGYDFPVSIYENNYDDFYNHCLSIRIFGYK